jgi:hypothetical protein
MLTVNFTKKYKIFLVISLFLVHVHLNCCGVVYTILSEVLEKLSFM